MLWRFGAVALGVGVDACAVMAGIWFYHRTEIAEPLAAIITANVLISIVLFLVLLGWMWEEGGR